MVYSEQIRRILAKSDGCTVRNRKRNGEPVFPGLSRDFEADSVMLEEQVNWQQLVERSEMPDKSTDAYNAKQIKKI